MEIKTYNQFINEAEENYMFFQNIKEIKENIDAILSMQVDKVDKILSDGHGWALEHIATAKDDIEEVASFLKHRSEGEESTDNSI